MDQFILYINVIKIEYREYDRVKSANQARRWLLQTLFAIRASIDFG